VCFVVTECVSVIPKGQCVCLQSEPLGMTLTVCLQSEPLGMCACSQSLIVDTDIYVYIYTCIYIYIDTDI